MCFVRISAFPVSMKVLQDRLVSAIQLGVRDTAARIERGLGLAKRLGAALQ